MGLLLKKQLISLSNEIMRASARFIYFFIERFEKKIKSQPEKLIVKKNYHLKETFRQDLIILRKIRSD